MGGPVSMVVVDMYIEDLEEEAMDTSPQNTKSSMWRWYINDSFEVMK